MNSLLCSFKKSVPFVQSILLGAGNNQSPGSSFRPSPEISDITAVGARGEAGNTWASLSFFFAISRRVLISVTNTPCWHQAQDYTQVLSVHGAVLGPVVPAVHQAPPLPSPSSVRKSHARETSKHTQAPPGKCCPSRSA